MSGMSSHVQRCKVFHSRPGVDVQRLVIGAGRLDSVDAGLAGINAWTAIMIQKGTNHTRMSAFWGQMKSSALPTSAGYASRRPLPWLASNVARAFYNQGSVKSWVYFTNTPSRSAEVVFESVLVPPCLAQPTNLTLVSLYLWSSWSKHTRQRWGALRERCVTSKIPSRVWDRDNDVAYGSKRVQSSSQMICH